MHIVNNYAVVLCMLYVMHSVNNYNMHNITYRYDAGKKKDTGNAWSLIEKHIFLSNRNKVQMNLVKQ